MKKRSSRGELTESHRWWKMIVLSGERHFGAVYFTRVGRDKPITINEGGTAEDI